MGCVASIPNPDIEHFEVLKSKSKLTMRDFDTYNTATNNNYELLRRIRRTRSYHMTNLCRNWFNYFAENKCEFGTPEMYFCIDNGLYTKHIIG